MNAKEYRRIEAHMLDCMRDGAHDSEHVYRVLRAALICARAYPQTDLDVLIAACLLHDIGRGAQFRDPSVCHAHAGAEMARKYLTEIGWSPEKAAHAADAIRTHRYRGDDEAQGIEAKILFDADKLDVAGALGIARTLLYQGQLHIPLYNIDEDGAPLDGCETGREESFCTEYQRKLKHVYDRFYTPEAEAMARARKAVTKKFYKSLLEETRALLEEGGACLQKALGEDVE